MTVQIIRGDARALPLAEKTVDLLTVADYEAML